MPILTEDYDSVESDSGDADENISATQDTCCIYLQPREDTVCFDLVHMQSMPSL